MYLDCFISVCSYSIYLDNLSYIDALFEAVSGITTTGATVFIDIEKQSPGILLGEQCCTV
ncbi:MAG: hypothetical protein ACR5KV_06560 [Wolbachia sp.]